MLWPVGAILVEGANLSIDGVWVVRGSLLDVFLSLAWLRCAGIIPRMAHTTK